MLDFWQPEDSSQNPVDTAKLEAKLKEMLEPKSESLENDMHMIL